MSAISPWVILVFGIALGACLPILLQALRELLRKQWFKPTLLHLDPLPPLPPTLPTPPTQPTPPTSWSSHDAGSA